MIFLCWMCSICPSRSLSPLFSKLSAPWSAWPPSVRSPRPLPFCWMQPIRGLAKRSEGWGHDAYFPSSFLYSLVVFLLKTTAPIRQPYVQLEVPLQFVTFWFCPLDPSRLGWHGPSIAKHEVLHHPLLVSLNPTYTFRNDAALLLNSPQLSHVVEKAMCILLSSEPHFLWCDTFFFFFCHYVFTEELSTLSASRMAVVASRGSPVPGSWGRGMLCSKRKAWETRWAH